MSKVTLTTFTGPMMGLSYECEPIFRKLETHFAGQIEFRYSMGLLVRNVYELCDCNELAQSPELALHRYNARLAKIYENEEIRSLTDGCIHPQPVIQSLQSVSCWSSILSFLPLSCARPLTSAPPTRNCLREALAARRHKALALRVVQHLLSHPPAISAFLISDSGNVEDFFVPLHR